METDSTGVFCIGGEDFPVINWQARYAVRVLDVTIRVPPGTSFPVVYGQECACAFTLTTATDAIAGHGMRLTSPPEEIPGNHLNLRFYGSVLTLSLMKDLLH